MRNKALASKFKGAPCIICSVPGNGHHILSFKSRPDLDCENNIISLCFAHHREIHDTGLTAFAEKYKIEDLLTDRGYYFDEKWRYPEDRRWAEQ